MMMITDANQSTEDFGALAKGLEELGEEIGVSIRCQHEDIFNKMHRI
jgi:ACT domain-containing protein